MSGQFATTVHSIIVDTHWTHSHIVIQGTKGRHRSATLGTILGHLLDVPVCFLTFCGTEGMEWFKVTVPQSVADWLTHIVSRAHRVMMGPRPPQDEESDEDEESDQPLPAPAVRPKARPDNPDGNPRRTAAPKRRPRSRLTGPQGGLGLTMHPGDHGRLRDGSEVWVGRDGQIPVPPEIEAVCSDTDSDGRWSQDDWVDNMFEYRHEGLQRVPSM